MCGYCPGTTVGEARAFYEAVAKGTVTTPMALKMASHAARAELPERQRAELAEDPLLCANNPRLKGKLEKLMAWWDKQPSEKRLVGDFEMRLVKIRCKFDVVYEGKAFDALVARAPKESQMAIAAAEDLMNAARTREVETA
jgi:hypothetical protein